MPPWRRRAPGRRRLGWAGDRLAVVRSAPALPRRAARPGPRGRPARPGRPRAGRLRDRPGSGVVARPEPAAEPAAAVLDDLLGGAGHLVAALLGAAPGGHPGR